MGDARAHAGLTDQQDAQPRRLPPQLRAAGVRSLPAAGGGPGSLRGALWAGDPGRAPGGFRRGDGAGLPGPRWALLGQEELGGAEIGQALQEQRARIGDLERAFGLGERETTRVVEQKVRLGQHRFARRVLAAFGHRCGFCGFAPGPLVGHRLLVASHVKPWRASTDRERLDPRNGVAACPTHDAAFDTGLLTVNGGMKIHRAAPLEGLLASEPTSQAYFAAPTLAARLLLPPGAEGPARRYLDFHQEHVFVGEVDSSR